MNCFIHPENPANVNCSSCGEPLCDECIVHTQGNIFCRGCLTGAKPLAPAKIARPTISKFLLFIFVMFLPPGAGYMYMGLIKRGVSAMICFFFIVFLLSSGITGPAETLAAFAIIILYFACIFDSFSICRRINAGEAVEDGVGSIVNSLLSNKKLCAVIFVILAIIFASTILGFALRVLRTLLPLIIIAFGLYVIFGRKK